jgi:hypothetical protein
MIPASWHQRRRRRGTSSYAPYTTVLVATTGNDSNDGYTLPVRQISKASTIAAANPNVTTISIAAGTYDPFVVPRNSLAYVGVGATTIVDAGGNGIGVNLQSSRQITLQDFKIQNAGYFDYGIYGSFCHNPLISGVTIQDCGRGIMLANATAPRILTTTATNITNQIGIWLQGCAGALIEDATGSNCRLRFVYLQGSPNAIVRRCYAHDAPVNGTTGDVEGYGFELEAIYSGSTVTQGSDDILFEDCWATTCKYGFISKTSKRTTFSRCVAWSNSFGGFYFKGGQDGFVYHCDAYANRDGIAVLGDPDTTGLPSSGNTVRDTIVAGNTRYGIYTDNTAAFGLATDYAVNLTADYNDWASNTTALASLERVTKSNLAAWQAAGYGTHDQAVAPTYASTVYGGFALPGGSALLTAGHDGKNLGHTGV